MEVWLNKDDDKFRLPVLPSSFELITGNLNSVVNINDIGNINLIGKSELKAITINTFFPNQKYNFVEYTSFPEPYNCVKKIDKWRRSGEPIRLIITTTGINLLVAIESFSYGEEDGTGDVYYDLELKEYKKLKTKKVAKVKIPEPQRPTPPKPKKQRTYVVKRGDCLWNIAKKYYGKGSQWPKIYNKNKKVIGSNPNLIFPGQKFIIP